MITNEFTAEDAYASGNESLIAQAERLADKKARLKAQMAETAGIPMPQGQMVSGHYVKSSAAQMLAPVIGQALQTFQQRAVDKEASDLDRRAAVAATQHLASAPGPDATPQERMAWAQAGTRIPGLAPTMQLAVKDLIVSEPARQDAREERKALRSMTIDQAREKLEAQLADREKDRDLRRDLAKDSNDLRATLAAAMRSRSGGGSGSAATTPGAENYPWNRKGVKANDIKEVKDAEGNTIYIDKVSQQQINAGKIGTPAAAVTADRLDQVKKSKDASEGLQLIDQMEPLLGKATSSGMGNMRDQVYGLFGKSTDAGDAAGELAQMGAKLTQMAPRMPGQVSDADLKFLAATTGGLGDPTIPESRKRAVLNRVRQQFQRGAGQATREASGAVDPGPRAALEDAVKQHSAPPPKRMKFNPATGQLE